MKNKKADNEGVIPVKFEEDPAYKDVKRGQESADNDTDREVPPTDDAKIATDKAYLKNSIGKKHD